MADSDEEYERRRREKFRRERNDYDRRDERRGRESFEDRNRESWSGRNRESRREPYRDYDRNRRDRYSPQRHDISPPAMKRMRRDWDDGGSGSYSHGGYGGDVPYGGGGGGPMHGGGPPPHGNWGPGPGDMPPPQQPPYVGQRGPDPDFPCQPAMMNFKMFLGQQDDNITDEEAIKKYNEYKLDFKRTQINEFFLAHKDEEWFKAKYHPEECGRRKEEARQALSKRAEVFTRLLGMSFLDNVTVDLEKSEQLVRLLDAAVILMEGGTEFDLTALDEPDDRDDSHSSRSRQNSESQSERVERSFSQEDGLVRITFDKKKRKEEKDEQQEGEEEEKKSEETSEAADKTENGKEAPLDLPISAEQEELKKKASEFSQKQKSDEDEEEGAVNDDPESRKNNNKRKRAKTEYSYESGSDSDSLSGSESEPEPAPPGVEEDPLPPGTEAKDPDKKESNTRKNSSKKEGEKGEENEKDEDTREEGEEEPKPQALHKAHSIFLRNLAPTITKQEVEAMCRRYPGFIRVAIQDPQPERRFLRRGWVTFDRTVNIKDICWNLNNIRLRDCEMGAIVNRELKQRVRPINGQAATRQIAKADIKHAAKIVQHLDQKWNIWSEGEKKDVEKESFGLVSKNPVLKNITDYLVEEGDYEEEVLLGQAMDDKPKEANPEVLLDRDEILLKVLDRMILYLRIVHSFDFYSAVEYPDEDAMPHRCGIIHARGPLPPNRLTQNDINDWLSNFETKAASCLEVRAKLDNEEVTKLGKKDPDVEVEKFVTSNTQELAKDKWLCPLSGKKFKGPEFVRKHIFNKHGEKVEEVKKEVAFFNNYLMDSKRPQLAEHPGNKQNTGGSGPPARQDSYNMPPGGSSYQGPPQQGMMGYNQSRPMMYQGNRGNRRQGNRRSGPFQGGNYQSRPEPYRHEPRRERFVPVRRDRRTFRDWDAPEVDDAL